MSRYGATTISITTSRITEIFVTLSINNKEHYKLSIIADSHIFIVVFFNIRLSIMMLTVVIH